MKIGRSTAYAALEATKSRLAAGDYIRFARYGSFREYRLQARDVDGQTRPFRAPVFSWNLLQHVEWATDQP